MVNYNIQCCTNYFILYYYIDTKFFILFVTIVFYKFNNTNSNALNNFYLYVVVLLNVP